MFLTVPQLGFTVGKQLKVTGKWTDVALSLESDFRMLKFEFHMRGTYYNLGLFLVTFLTARLQDRSLAPPAVSLYRDQAPQETKCPGLPVLAMAAGSGGL